MLKVDESKKIILFGGAGYLGSVLTKLLLDAGYTVRVFDNFQYGSFSLSKLVNHPRLDIVTGDLRDIQAVSKAIRGFDAAILLAALSSAPACNKDPTSAVDINFLANLNVVYACQYYGVNQFIFASSHSVYGIQEIPATEDSIAAPISLYGEFKLSLERQILSISNMGFSPTILRMGTLFGLSPRMRFDLVLNAFVKDAITKGVLSVNGGEQWRPLVHVKDAAKAYLQVLEAPKNIVAYNVFNIGSDNQNIKIGDLLELVAQKINVKINTLPENEPDMRNYRVCHEKARRVLEYTTDFSIDFGIDEIITAFRAHDFDTVMDIKYYNYTK